MRRGERPPRDRTSRATGSFTVLTGGASSRPARRPYADARIAEERGAYEHGHPVGRWTFLDDAGAIVRALDLGMRPLDDDVAGARGVRRRGSLGRRVVAAGPGAATEGHLREALCAAARAAARSGSTEALRALLAETTVPMHAEASAAAVAGLADEKGTVPRALSALVSGADPASVLRTLASVLKGAVRASADLVEAAILLAPERRMAYMTRALLRLELGDPRGRGGRRSGRARDRGGGQLPAHLWPAAVPDLRLLAGRETPESTLEDLPEAPVQPLEAVRRTIQVYASASPSPAPPWRRGRPVRPGCRRRSPSSCPRGRWQLRAYDAEIVDETDQGPEASTVRVDETLAIAAGACPR